MGTGRKSIWIALLAAFAVLLGTAFPGLAAVITTDLQLHYDAANADGLGNAGSDTQSTWTDLTGNNHSGALNAFEYTSSSGWVYNAAAPAPFRHGLKLDGMDSYVNMAGANFNQNSLTYEVWLRVDSATTHSIIGEYTASSNTRNYLTVTPGGAVRFDQYPPSGGGMTTDVDFVPVGEYVQLVFTKSNSTANVHLNGGATAGGKTFETNYTEQYGGSSPVYPWLGRRYHPSGYYGSDAMVSILRVYDRALTGQEVADNYSSTMIPEPASLALLGVGGLALALRRRRRRIGLPGFPPQGEGK